MKALTYLLFVIFIPVTIFAQEEQEKEELKQIHIVYGANFTIDEESFPGGKIFTKDERQLQFEHQGADLWCDIAILFPKDNTLKAIGNIRLEQGDSIQMTGQKLRYNGNTKMAKAWENVILTNQQGTLTTDTLYFDRENQRAFYKNYGKVVDSVNTLTSKIGTYFTDTKKYQFKEEVDLVNPDNHVVSTQLDYFSVSKNLYMYGPSTITGDTYKMYCERGFYNTTIERGYGVKNTRIDYNDRIIYGDSLYFDKKTQFASATNNIRIIDTINNGVIRAHYAEIFKEKDSVFATKRAVSISLVEKDSLFIHGDTLMITGKADSRILRAFRNAKFYKTDLSGKCDSIHFSEVTGVTKLIREPVIWSGENQMTGDSIQLLSNLETEKLDSLKVLNNAFIVSLDSISKTGYNQAKGKDLFGKFIDNELKYVDLIKNTEVIYYMYNDKDESIGINKSICSKIRISFLNSEIEDLDLLINVDGDIFPVSELPPNARKLKGFIWRGDERILTKDDIFDEDDNTIELVKIRGIDNPLTIEEEEAQREKESKENLEDLNKPKAILKKDKKPKKKIE